MERYEKLYNQIDEVFKGTPNTPSALAVKSEIVENLIARYDELLEQGVNEDEAVDRVIDTVGNLDELFGEKKGSAPAQKDAKNDAADQPDPTEQTGQTKQRPTLQPIYLPNDAYRTLTPEEEAGIRKRKTIRTFAIVLYIISIIPNILIGTVFAALVAEALMFTIWALATALIIGAGAYSPGADAKKRWLIGCGVGMYIFAFVPMFLLVDSITMVGISLMFVGWALATMLVIFGASRKNSSQKVKYDKKTIADGLDSETRQLWKRIEPILVLITLFVYLWFSFKTGGWAYSWLIWLIYGCIGDAVKALLVLLGSKGDNR